MTKRKSENVLTFRNVRLRPFTVVRKKEGPPFVRAHFIADLSEPIRQTMGWSIGEGQSGGKFGAVVNATSIVLAPNQKAIPGMGPEETYIEVTELNEFSFKERIDKDGSVNGIDLLFAAVSSDPEAETRLGIYWRSVLGGDAVMKVEYTLIGKNSSGGSAEEDE